MPSLIRVTQATEQTKALNERSDTYEEIHYTVWHSIPFIELPLTPPSKGSRERGAHATLHAPCKCIISMSRRFAIESRRSPASYEYASLLVTVGSASPLDRATVMARKHDPRPQARFSRRVGASAMKKALQSVEATDPLVEGSSLTFARLRAVSNIQLSSTLGLFFGFHFLQQNNP